MITLLQGFVYLFYSITQNFIQNCENGINNVYLEMQDILDRIDKRRISPMTVK